MDDNTPSQTDSVGAGGSGSLFSHDETAQRSTTEQSDIAGRPHRKSDDEAGPGRPLEMRFSGDGEPSDRRAAS